jgi:hypothetical protein
MPEVRVAVKPGTGQQVAAHEALHAQAALPYEPGPVNVSRPTLPDLRTGLTPDWYKAEHAYWDSQRAAAFEKLGPRDRELWRVFKALRNEEQPHAAHETYSVDSNPADKGLAVREAALRERVKAADGVIAEAELRLSKLKPGSVAHAALLAQRDALAAVSAPTRAALDQMKQAQKP